MLSRIKEFFKKEIVFSISLFFALLTAFAVPPDKEYLKYIDFRVLCLLFCLMAVVAGLKSIGVFRWLTCLLLSKVRNGRLLGISLVLLPFFSSMLVTNDVALIVFIPFTIALLCELECNKSIVPIIVLQTVAANLGSVATPVGNPQNLYLFSVYNLRIGEFFSVTLPICAVSFVLLIIFSAFILPSALSDKAFSKEVIDNKKNLVLLLVLFILCLLTVFRVIPYILTTVIVFFAFVAIDIKRLKEVDYILLLTFVFFFVISENLGRIEGVRDFLQNLLTENPFLTSVGASQVISNVPAAVLLSGFTDNWRAILSGVNIGGLGTPVASLASVITLKIYMKCEGASALKFLLVFSLVNVLFLIILITFAVIQ